MTRRSSRFTALDRWSLAVLAGFTAVSTFGFGYYALHPENLPANDLALRLYSVSFNLFAQVHILLAFTALAVMLVSRTGLRWVPALLAVYLLSFTSEHVGTGYGIPFGGYEYTGLLGARVGPRVPALIPLSWFLMALPSWIVARTVFPGRRLAAVVLGAVGLVLWDLALDPAMSYLTPYWRWEDAGPYYGMPWLNLVGWFTTGLALMAVLAAAHDRAGFDELPAGWMLVFYGLVVLLPLGMLAVAGAWVGVVTTVSAMVLTAVAATTLGRLPSTVATASEATPEAVGAS